MQSFSAYVEYLHTSLHMKNTYPLAFRYLSVLIFLGGFVCSSFSAPVGSTAFSFGLKDQNDTLTQLEDFRGQGIILDF